jgi:hypothetical protein
MDNSETRIVGTRHRTETLIVGTKHRTETLIVGTRHRTETNQTKTTQKTKMISNTDPPKKPGVNPYAREGHAIPASHKTSTMLLI